MDIETKRNELQNLSIHDLRNISRMWGIESPTLMKKDQLINKLLKIMSGEEVIDNKQKKHKSGRPVKSRITAQDIEKKFLPNSFLDFIEEFTPMEYQSTDIVFSQVLENEITNCLTKRKGYLCERESSSFICDTDSNIITIIPKAIVVQYALEVGDFLEIISAGISEKIYEVVREICKINGHDVSFEPRHLTNFKNIILNEKPDKIEKIIEGTKNHIISKNCYDFIEENTKLFEAFNKKSYQILIVAVGLQADGQLRFERFLKGKYFVSFFENKPIFSFEAILSAINHATILAREGKKILLVILDIEKIYNELDLYFSSRQINAEMHSYQAKTLLRRLTSLNRCLNNGGSLTLITTSINEKFAYYTD